MKNKSKYKVQIHEVYNGVKSMFNICRDTKPNINDYRNFFSPKLSNCYSIKFYQLNEDNHYETLEVWFKTKHSWKKYV